MQLHSTLSEDGTLESEESHLFREDRVLLELCEKWTIDSEKSCEVRKELFRTSVFDEVRPEIRGRTAN